MRALAKLPLAITISFETAAHAEPRDVLGMRVKVLLTHGISAENHFIRMCKTMITICFLLQSNERRKPTRQQQIVRSAHRRRMFVSVARSGPPTSITRLSSAPLSDCQWMAPDQNEELLPKRGDRATERKDGRANANLKGAIKALAGQQERDRD